MPSFVRTSHFATQDPRPLTDLVFVAVLAFLLLLFILALGHQRKGHKDIWYSPVNALDGSGHDSKAGKLPAPVTARRSHSQSKPQYTQYTPAPKRHVSEKRTYERRPSQSRQPQPQTAYIPERRPSQSRQPQPQTTYNPERRPSQSRQPQPQTAYMPERRTHRSRPTERYRPDYYARDASPRR
jgi:FtsZ-interacting cell division protein ZipA